MTEVYQDKTTKKVSMSVTLFIDDLGTAVNFANHAAEIQAGKLTTDDLILRYLREKMEVWLNDKKVTFSLARTENDFQSVTCYLDLKPALADIQKLQVKSRIMLELYEDQRNMVQVKLPGKKEGAMMLDKKKMDGQATF